MPPSQLGGGRVCGCQRGDLEGSGDEPVYGTVSLIQF